MFINKVIHYLLIYGCYILILVHESHNMYKILSLIIKCIKGKVTREETQLGKGVVQSSLNGSRFHSCWKYCLGDIVFLTRLLASLFSFAFKLLRD